MATEYIASCSCGYEADAFVGSTRMRFKTEDFYPALCEECNEVVSTNRLGAPSPCPKCGTARVVPYDSGSLHLDNGRMGPDTRRMALVRKEMFLETEKFLCPECEQHSLKFKLYAIVD